MMSTGIAMPCVKASMRTRVTSPVVRVDKAWIGMMDPVMLRGFTRKARVRC